MPGLVAPLKEHPLRWIAGITIAAVGVAFGYTRWHTRLAMADDTTGSDASGSGTTVEIGQAAQVMVAPATVAGDHARAAVTQQTRDIYLGDVVQQALPVPVLPGQVVNLPPRNAVFTGRENLLDRLGAELLSGPVAVAAVHGLGGIGKSQVALEYAHRGVASGQYKVVWWVRAEDPMVLAEDLAALAPGLGVPTVADQERVIAGVRAVLHERRGWLLVFDNVPDADAIRSWVPDGSGHVVVTSRSRRWDGLARLVDVPEFTRQESVDYLCRVTGESGLSVQRLAALLGDLPLALSQAVGYMQHAGGLSVAGYLALYEDQQSSGQLLAASAGDGYPESVATTWLMHFQQLSKTQPAALELLRLIAFLNPDDIDLGMLLGQPDGLDSRLTQGLKVACTSSLGLTDTVAALTATNLATRLDDSRVRVHRLVAQMTRHQSALDITDQEWAGQTVSLLWSLVPVGAWKHENWPRMAFLAPHITAASEHSPDNDTLASLLNAFGNYLHERADFGSARLVLQRSLAICEAVYGPCHSRVAAALASLGIVQAELGELEAAKAGLERALAISEAVFGPDHPQVAAMLTNLGNVQELLGELGAAMANLERALAISEAVFGPDHPQVAVTLTNLGSVQRRLGELEAAKASQERALAINEAVFGPDHPQVAATLTNLGTVQRRLGELEAAKAGLERALAISEAVFGPLHPRVAIALSNLGNVQEQLGEPDEAKASQERALAIKQANQFKVSMDSS